MAKAEDSKKKAQAARAKQSGIAPRKDGHMSPPAGFPEMASSYADPTNYMFPIHDEAHIRNALARFSQFGSAYPESDRKKVYTRIVRAAVKAGIKVKPSKEQMNMLPGDLKTKLSKSTLYFIKTEDALEVRTSAGESTDVRFELDENGQPHELLSALSLTETHPATLFEFEINIPQESDSVEKAMHGMGDSHPSDQKLSQAAKESTDGVVIAHGRKRGDSDRVSLAVAFNAELWEDEDAKKYLEHRGMRTELRNAHGAKIAQQHEKKMFADGTFVVSDPVKEYGPFYRSMDSTPAAVVPNVVMALPTTTSGSSRSVLIPAATTAGYSFSVSDDTTIVVENEANAAIEKSAGVSFFVPFKKDIKTVVGKDTVIRSVIYPADRTDGHNEYASADDLKKAAHGWLMHSREMNIEHTPELASGVLPAESYIAKAAEPEIDAHPGDWCGVFYVSDEDTKKSISLGVYRGFSIEGGCTKVREGTRKRMTDILVTKISLVKDPATRIEWVAKGKNAQILDGPKEGSGNMEQLKKQLDTLQEQIVKLGSKLGTPVPQCVPTFKALATEQDLLLHVAGEQVSFLAKYVENATCSVDAKLAESVAKLSARDSAETLLKEQLAKAVADLNDAKSTVEAYRTVPGVQELEARLLAGINGEGQ